jgi:catechol 2,3-dioxygenase-like lactoylglutathione lyase family enzyme
MQTKRGIDHIVHCVRDLDAAIARFEAFGFTLTRLHARYAKGLDLFPAPNGPI